MKVIFPVDTPLMSITDDWWTWLQRNEFKDKCYMSITNWPDISVTIVTEKYDALYIYYLKNFAIGVDNFEVVKD